MTSLISGNPGLTADKSILGFFDQYEFLSNFYPSKISIEGIEYPTVEHAFQALKTSDIDEKLSILGCNTPGQAKRLGQKVKLRSDWEDIKIDLMFVLSYLKYASSLKLSTLLKATGEAYLEETNHWGDKFWGVCDGEGRNELGKILMRVRSILKHV